MKPGSETLKIGGILEEIFSSKRQEVQQRKIEVPLEKIIRQAQAATPPVDFSQALSNAKRRHSSPALIAEIKFASPSKGIFGVMKKPVELAGLYLQNGAAAVSVLTDERYFQGHLNYLSEVSATYPEAATLRKDFIFDVYQVFEARAAGASAVLLIASMLSEEEIAFLQESCQGLGMAALVEVHSTEEVEKALRCNSHIIGINQRNLKDFSVDATNGLRLRALIPPGIITVAESGIRSAVDVQRLAEAGFDAILVGEALVKAADIGKKTRELSRLGG